jgi:hypothetical protein
MLKDLITSGVANALPRAGVLVLQPVVADIVGRPNPSNGCDLDPQADAFADWQRVDGCRLLWYAWPTEWLPLLEPGDLTDPVQRDRWRNRLAYTIFSAEKDNAPDQFLPWEEIGVPIALVGFDAAWTPVFVDRYSVVRSGGKPKRRTALVPGAGNPFLWQARIQQFAEQLADLDLNTLPIEQVASRFAYLPPLGLLPKTAIDVRGATNSSAGVNHFFPASYRMQAAPVPMEQLDVVMQASASLVSFTLANVDQVQILVPVPQNWYEPNLLKREQVDPLFQQTIDEMVTRRAEWLNRQEIVRSRNTLIGQAISGTPPAYPTPDPDRLEDELDQPSPPFSSTRAHQSSLAPGLHQHYFDGATATLSVGTGDRLTTYIYLDPDHPPTEIMLQWHSDSWEHRAYWGESQIALGQEGTNSRRSIGALPATGQWVRLEVPANLVGLEGATLTGMAFVLFNGRAVWGHSGKTAAGASPANDTIWVGNDIPTGATPQVTNDSWTWIQGRELLTPLEDDYQTTVDANGARQLTPLQTLKAQLASQVPSEVSQLDTLGLEKFITLLQSKVTRANDKIDFHFTQVQTSIYRVRQPVLGSEVASRLVTSPILAAIAEGGESARSTQQQLSTYIDLAKTVTVPTQTDSPAPAPTASPSSSSGPIKIAAETLSNISTQSLTLFAQSGFNQPSLLIPSDPTSLKLGRIVNLPGVGDGVLADSGSFQLSPNINLVQQQTSGRTGILFGRPPIASPEDVIEQSPLVGAISRTVTVGERLEPPAAVQTRTFAIASRTEAISSLASLDLDISDLPILGSQKPGSSSTPFTFGDFKASGANTGTILQVGDLTDTHEASYFYDSVKHLDNTVAILRLIEGRVQNYRAAIYACQQVLVQLRDLTGQVNQRLQAIANRLAEARQDVAVARALLAEEQTRVDGINQRRDRIVQDHVPFLVFHRPRFTDVLLDAPLRPLDPGITTSPVPDCLNRNIPTPAELQAFLEILREAPAIWFTQIPRLIDRFDRFDMLYRVLQTAQLRTSLPLLAPPTSVFTSRYSQPLNQAIASQRQVMLTYRQQTAQFNLNSIVGQSWRQVRDQSEAILSLADLLNPDHGRSDIIQQAANHLDNITHVATCLYTDFGDVLPVIRLDWAERLSQYDAPVNLRNLASLPRWGEIPLLQRREIQTLVDWLYQQVNPYRSDAIAFINDLVRVCILLASHAPINQIISGRLLRPTPIIPGKRIDLSVDPSLIRVGMSVFLYSPTNEVVAKGIVEDLATGQASARILQTTGPTLNLAENARAHFSFQPLI